MGNRFIDKKVYGKIDKDKYYEVICPKCEYIQWELKTDDKTAIECRSCQTVYEESKIHLLSRCTNVRYDRGI